MDRRTFWWGLIGGIPVFLGILAAGLYISNSSWMYRIIHTVILLIFVVGYGVLSIKTRSRLLKLGVILVVLFIHLCVISLDKGYWDFHVRILYLALIYGVFGLMGGVFIPLYYNAIVAKRLRNNGIEAIGFVEEAWQAGSILRENGVHKKYKVKLTLRIEGHPKSPYIVTDFFWISEYYLQDIRNGSTPIPLKVNRKNHKKVVLDYSN